MIDRTMIEYQRSADQEALGTETRTEGENTPWPGHGLTHEALQDEEDRG